jgi:thymidylate synthase
LQLSREPLRAPRVRLAPKSDLFAFEPEDIVLEGYRPHPTIPAPIAV